ncbi:glycosyltransferase family 8 protein [Serendipita vermifera MAFF 305830]|uniref:Glycosyltransferase family 8 protein n=1 Tax=Serendipita vermifera MAFF 305830 TaxID=933852 RepID=A0A0C3AK83_SERVB|nr:glycosyltransferase family 8 protein [Serendipita vermifera MAFF 305830]
MGLRAYMTLLSRSSYLAGAMVLHHSLQAAKAKYPLIILVTSTLPEEDLQILARSGIETKQVELLLLPESRYDQSKTEARFTDIWTKVRVFELEEYEKIVFLDSDMLVRRNMDEMFDYPISANQVAATYACACNPMKIPHYPKDWVPENCGYSQPDYPACLEHLDLSAPKPRPHDLLNSGMFLCRPSRDLMARMRKMLDTTPLIANWKFCDQDLIGTFFGGGGEEPEGWGDITKEEIGDPWMHVPYYYNALKTLKYVHPEFWRDEDIRAIHYILRDKPWTVRPPASETETYEPTMRWWWASYNELLEKLETDGRKVDIGYIESHVAPKT